MTGPAMTHADADRLLPLLLAGSLSDAELRAVREHVAGCLACRREQKHLARVSRGVRSGTAIADVPPANMAPLLGRIDRYEERRRRNPFVRVAQAGKDHPFATLAAQAALVLLAVFLLVTPSGRDAEFVTLSDPPGLPAGGYVRAVFDPALDPSSIVELAGSLHLRVVEGPSVRGVYTLAPSVRSGTADYDALAAALRANDEVLFAEAIRIGALP